jgi:AraC family transcriptional regulator
MIDVRIESKGEFNIIGQKRYITQLEQFAEFWKTSHDNGLIEKLNHIRNNHGCPVTKGTHIGLSCTEKDPDNRDFYFFISVEYPQTANSYQGLETHTIHPLTWAIFSKKSTEVKALFECEMYAFKEWLPVSEYKHALGPEMEVYHEDKIEFWLPIIKK